MQKLPILRLDCTRQQSLMSVRKANLVFHEELLTPGDPLGQTALWSPHFL